VARKPSTKSNGSTRRAREIHPKRTGIVWTVFIGAMTLVCGVLLMSERWTAIPAIGISESGVQQRSIDIEPGRWRAIVIHHSGSYAGTVRDMAQQQAHEWGFPSIGYHFVIGNGNGEYDGDIITCPRWFNQQSGAHVADRAPGARPDAGWFNDNAIGVCLIGNGERREFTDAQMKSLMTLVRHLQVKCDIPASAVYLHSDLVQVASPGVYFPRATFNMALDTRAGALATVD
jgi:hypothetical protein